MGQLSAVDPPNPYRFYHLNLFTNAISRFTTISLIAVWKKLWAVEEYSEMQDLFDLFVQKIVL